MLVSGFIGGGFGRRGFAWSPDSKWIAYAASGDRALRNVYVVPAAGGSSRARSPSWRIRTSAAIQWSPDGKFLLYETGQRTETPQVARVDLVPRQPKFAEERFEDLFKPEPARRGRARRRRAQAAGEASRSTSTTSASASRCCRSG